MSSTAFFQTVQSSKLQNKIGWICQALRWLVVIWLAWSLIFISLPLLNIADAVNGINADLHFVGDQVTAQKFLANRFVVFLDWATATLIGVTGWKLMTGYLHGDIFSESAATKLKWLGRAALTSTVVDILIQPLATWLLSPAYFHTIPIWSFIAPQNLLHILFSGFVLSLAHIFYVAAEINAENKSFI